MCTVAYVPFPGGGYLLGHNRDERRTRSRGRPPSRHRLDGIDVLAPSDPDGGGSWIGLNRFGLTCCVLNAQGRPGREPTRPLSRGRVLWDLLPLASLDELETRLRAWRPRLDQVRAFHLIGCQPGRGERPAQLGRFRWDGRRLRGERHRGPGVFVSSSLDPLGAGTARRAAWRRLLAEHPRPGAALLRGWLAGHEPQRGPLSVCMHRPEARTVSRTLVQVSDGVGEMSYVDGPPCSPVGPETRLRLRGCAAPPT